MRDKESVTESERETEGDRDRNRERQADKERQRQGKNEQHGERNGERVSRQIERKGDTWRKRGIKSQDETVAWQETERRTKRDPFCPWNEGCKRGSGKGRMGT